MMKRGILIGIAAALLVTSSGFAASRWIITSTRQIKPNVLRQLRGKRGPRGSAGQRGQVGPAGPAGPAGATGAAGISSVQYVTGAPVSYCSSATPSCSSVSANATCPAGSYAVGGAANGGTIDTTVYTYIDSGEYSAVLSNSSSFTGSLSVTAACASGPGLSAYVAHVRKGGTASAEAAALLARLRSQTG